jgi:hypothetical protein
VKRLSFVGAGHFADSQFAKDSAPNKDSVLCRVRAQAFMAVLALFLAAFGAGCATGYKPSGFGGGYSETMYAPDVFLVHFDGNEHTSPERSRDFGLLRAADLTVQHGYRYFLFSDQTRAVAPFSPPIPAQTAQVNNYNYGNTYVNNPNSTSQYNDPNAEASQNAGAGLSNLANFLAFQSQLRQLAQTEILVHCFVAKPPGIETCDATLVAKSLRVKYGIKVTDPER